MVRRLPWAVVNLEKLMHKETLFWSKEDALERFSGSHNILYKIVSLFIVDATNIMVSLKSAIEQKDFRNIKVYAHTLKGSSSNISAFKLQDCSEQIEKSALEEDVASIELLYGKLQSVWSQTVEKLKEYLESNKKCSIIHRTDDKIQEVLVSLKDDLESAHYIDTQKSDISSIETSAEIKSELNKLLHEIDSFEFEKALSIVNNLLDKLYDKGENE